MRVKFLKTVGFLFNFFIAFEANQGVTLSLVALTQVRRVASFAEFQAGQVFLFLGVYARPYPDHSKLPSYQHKAYSDTPTAINGQARLVDDYQPRVNMRKEFEDGTLKERILTQLHILLTSL